LTFTSGQAVSPADLKNSLSAISIADTNPDGSQLQPPEMSYYNTTTLTWLQARAAPFSLSCPLLSPLHCRTVHMIRRWPLYLLFHPCAPLPLPRRTFDCTWLRR
jgi:hypothetical protein